MGDARRFRDGAAVIGAGWIVRLGRLRVVWAPTPDPDVDRVVLHVPNNRTIHMHISWGNLVTKKGPNT